MAASKYSAATQQVGYAEAKKNITSTTQKLA